MFTNHSTGIARVDAHEDFARARRAHLAARTVGRLAGRRRARNPRVYDDSNLLPGGAPRLEVIALDAIVGTLDPTVAFDDRFRPASDLVRARWERVALAHRRSISLPAISVRRGPDGYYVVDGRHRVSVARALGHRDIEAWVTDARPHVAAALPCAA
jgi:hypothetical protein